VVLCAGLVAELALDSCSGTSVSTGMFAGGGAAGKTGGGKSGNVSAGASFGGVNSIGGSAEPSSGGNAEPSSHGGASAGIGGMIGSGGVAGATAHAGNPGFAGAPNGGAAGTTASAGAAGADNAAGAGGGDAQCAGNFAGYLRDFTIADANGMVMLPSSITLTKLNPDGSNAWWKPGASAPTAETVNGVVYKVSPDFEVVTHAGAAKQYNVDDKGIVGPTLGADQTPVYAGDPTNGTPSTTGAANFATWFHDTEGINLGQELDLQFVRDSTKPNDPNAYVFGSGATGVSCTAAMPTYCSGFYPIDGKQLGNEGNTHNYHMTFELHLKFRYHQGQIFTFTGDDDVWAYVNSKLALNLGGVHQQEVTTVNLTSLGLIDGAVYPLDFFWCERHITASNFHIEMNLDVVDCGTIRK
jgi:fibro-slime domain-containing protein